jgi:hypothetical protein
MEGTRAWAVSCNELYNLFAGQRPLVEAMLGLSIEEAETQFLAFAENLSLGDQEYPPLKAAKLYAALHV